MPAFTENVKRAHFQSLLWRDISLDPRSLNPEGYGWTKDEVNKTMTPTYAPENIKPVPDYMLETVKCGCKSATPCSTKRCGCKEKGISCTIFVHAIQSDVPVHPQLKTRFFTFFSMCELFSKSVLLLCFMLRLSAFKKYISLSCNTKDKCTFSKV